MLSLSHHRMFICVSSSKYITVHSYLGKAESILLYSRSIHVCRLLGGHAVTRLTMGRLPDNSQEHYIICSETISQECSEYILCSTHESAHHKTCYLACKQPWPPRPHSSFTSDPNKLIASFQSKRVAIILVQYGAFTTGVIEIADAGILELFFY
jgi:hypothetical protein